jgi:cysteinyl-tRNA synthetase
VITVLHDELNTPGAFGAIFSLVNRKGGEADLASFDRVMFALGLDLKVAEAPKTDVPAAITALADKRWAAKQAKDWAGADALRKELTAAGWNMKDGKDGYTLEPLKK